MAKGDRWSDNQTVQVREMRNAETVLGVNRDHWRAAVRSKYSCPVRRGAVGKGLLWQYLAGRLPYEFDEDGRAVKADIYRWRAPTAW